MLSAVLIRLGRRRGRPAPGLERLLLPIAVAVFVAATVVAFRNLPHVEGGVRWWLLALSGLVGVPLTVLLNAREYELSARVLGHRVPFLESARVSLIASAANQLPVPGSVLVRVRALRRLGSSYGKAGSSTAIVGLAWIAITGILAGAFQLSASRWGFGAALITIGLAVLMLSFGLMAPQVRIRSDRWALMRQIALVEAALVVVLAVRFSLALRALGFDVSASQAVALTISVVVASALGIFPGGLGIRELLAAGIGPLVGLPASVGLAATAVDRLTALVVLVLTSVVLYLVGFYRTPAPDPATGGEG
jgi:uncharacterized membrane protein YbhN (UPF0104 family)